MSPSGLGLEGGADDRDEDGDCPLKGYSRTFQARRVALVAELLKGVGVKLPKRIPRQVKSSARASHSMSVFTIEGLQSETQSRNRTLA